ncbi:MAG: methylenetetrahydrofolate--tRNA-(uracil(54)-C(5))-methyltransferase (FADH(2)-oxidizing) TrmFO [Atopobium sp.]|uniref:methylenetetrahydrofolate--tRNA-(uracil(54)- C(5))-methyltransferase (FADH(2)-oxidizing) TrmFO n=1 Tax=Atopobium sp. TaxID=1872650 RepID=UPI002A7F0695|nr:methylenetetrahydrofolate--tRNA-(uracil(54)-C(5))-methyltransferase (FADH(2)-oxidizing) TrmFO [Atopobium sp.]MDY4523316.1 methylenetetrahydrofolate--tRNA-(uracil(54)-C(5))-methyltransferase (FADH(2)-oxidizing) TrmFO [Atopobium sp.]
MSNTQVVTVVGGGLAGSECALQLARRGISVHLYEQRPQTSSPAHHSDKLAELVCSNSLKSMREASAAGLLKHELLYMGSELMRFAVQASVPAGAALAVDRDVFSNLVTQAIESNPNIRVFREEVRSIPEGPCVIAAGPLCSEELFAAITARVGSGGSSFYDAAAPIVDTNSLNREIIFEQSRYGTSGTGDYLNCPLNKQEYDAFIDELLKAKRAISKDFDQSDLFNACQPVEEIARTGRDSLRFGTMKPVGLTDPRTGKRPWAAVQLRPENKEGTSYNLVGFQTNLTWGEQKRVFCMIPGLEHAEFFRYGVMHRNSFLDSPHVLDASFALPGTQTRFAGQITGTEGYVEAIASGMLAALNTVADLSETSRVQLPDTGAFGSLVAYATNPQTEDYQPMHVNFGIIRPLDQHIRSKKERYVAYAARATNDLHAYISSRSDLFFEGIGKNILPKLED